MSEQSWRASNGSVFDASGCIAVCDTDNADAATYAKRAVLMAAAPNMLATLKRVREYMDTVLGNPTWQGQNPYHIILAICDAIAKAEAA